MNRQRILILGGDGLMASALHHYLGGQEEFAITRISHGEADVTNCDSLLRAFQEHRPHWVINGAGFLGPDRCETEMAQSHAINFCGVKNILRALAQNSGVGLIHFSTDYVFDGRDGGYEEHAPARPLCYYGLHKLLADEIILSSSVPAYIFRVASVVGAGSGKQDIVKALLARYAAGAPSLSVVKDMEISTVSTQFLAQTVERFIKNKPPYGLYNCVAQGQTTWFDIVRVAFDELGLKTTFEPILASAFPRPAPRPMKSWLKTDKLAQVLGLVPGWEEMIRSQIAAEKSMYLAILNKDEAA